MLHCFLKILNNAISAGWLILAVILLRFLMRKAPKWMRGLLWGLVALRLLCPFSIESAYSLNPFGTVMSAKNIQAHGQSERMENTDGQVSETALSTEGKGTLESGAAAGEEGIWAEIEVAAKSSDNPDAGGLTERVQNITLTAILSDWWQVFAVLWFAGFAGILLYGALNGRRLQKRVSPALCLEDNIWLCDDISSAFIMGLRNPRIYVPSFIDEASMQHVISHEQAHLRRHDHLWKLLGFLLLAAYWFQPLVWAAYILFCRDIEFACDESVIRKRNADFRKAYAQTLFDLSLPGGRVTAYPLAFGEISVKERVKSVLTYKKPAFWTVLAAIAACMVAAVCFMTTLQRRAETAVVLEEDPLIGIASADEDEEALLKKYEAFGVTEKEGALFYQGERIRFFLDGYERDDGQGGTNLIARWKQYDKQGTIDVHTVREDKVLPDGSTELFGPIVDIVPYSQEEFDKREYVDDTETETATEAEEVPIQKIIAEELGEATAANTAYEEGNGGQSLEEYFEPFGAYGITWENDSGGLGNVYYNGERLEEFVDKQPDGSIFLTQSASGGRGVAYTIYDEQGKLAGVSVR